MTFELGSLVSLRATPCSPSSRLLWNSLETIQRIRVSRSWWRMSRKKGKNFFNGTTQGTDPRDSEIIIGPQLDHFFFLQISPTATEILKSPC